jgi:hypothetical protein
VLSVIQTAATRLPGREDSHLDRLFALECLARAGDAGGVYVERLRESQRQAEWWIQETWDADAPHAAALAQALATRQALSQELPAGWHEQLLDALTAIGKRRGVRFSPTSDARLVAAFLRGLAAVGLTAPKWLLKSATDAVEARSGAVGQAELADALARHPSSTDLARAAFSATFNGAGIGDEDAPYARWWLATRSAPNVRLAAVSPEALAAARLQALATAAPGDGHVAAMLLEAAGANASDLVIDTREALARVRSKRERATLLRLAAFQAAFFIGVLTLLLIRLHPVSHRTARVLHVHDVETVRRAIAGLVVFAIGFTISRFIAGVSIAFNRKPPRWLQSFETAVSVLAGVVAAASV